MTCASGILKSSFILCLCHAIIVLDLSESLLTIVLFVEMQSLLHNIILGYSISICVGFYIIILQIWSACTSDTFLKC